MTSLGVAERAEGGREAHREAGGKEKGPVSGLLCKPGAFQTLSKAESPACVKGEQRFCTRSRSLHVLTILSLNCGARARCLGSSPLFGITLLLFCAAASTQLRSDFAALLQRRIPRAGVSLPSPLQPGAAGLARTQLKCSASLNISYDSRSPGRGFIFYF